MDEVAKLALELPETAEGASYGHLAWLVGRKAFAWERPFSKADLRRVGDELPPEGPILAVLVRDRAEKEAALQAHPASFFTIPHFDGYPAVLIQLGVVTKSDLRAALVDGWLAAAPKHLVALHADSLVRRR